MAGIDTSVYSNLLRPPRSVEEYDAEAMQAQGNKLALAAQRAQFDQAQRAEREQADFRNKLSSISNYEDPQAQRALYQASPSAAAAFLKSQADARKAQAELAKTNEESTGIKLRNAKDVLNQHLQGLGSVATPQDLYAWADQGVKAGVPGITPERLTAITQELNQNPASLPDLIRKIQMGGVELVKQIDLTIPKYERQDTGGSIQFAQMNPLAGPVGVSPSVAAIKKTQSPESLASTAATIRGQNLSDARARERLDFDRQQPKGQYDAERGLLIDPRTGEARPVTMGGQPVAPKAKSGPMSVTLQKELIESDDNVQSAAAAIESLRKAKTINDAAYSGYGASTRAALVSNLGGSESADATVELDNLIGNQALGSLKSIFGAAPTEGERKILIDLQASSDKSPAQRATIIDRAIKAAEVRAKYANSKAQSIRSGKYLTEGAPIPDAGGAAPASATVKVTSDADYMALKPGTKFITPDGKTGTKR